MSAVRTLTANFYIFHLLIKEMLRRTDGTPSSPRARKHLSVRHPMTLTVTPTLQLETTDKTLTIQDHSTPPMETSTPVLILVVNMQQQVVPIRIKTKIKINSEETITTETPRIMETTTIMTATMTIQTMSTRQCA